MHNFIGVKCLHCVSGGERLSGRAAQDGLAGHDEGAGLLVEGVRHVVLGAAPHHVLGGGDGPQHEDQLDHGAQEEAADDVAHAVLAVDNSRDADPPAEANLQHSEAHHQTRSGHKPPFKLISLRQIDERPKAHGCYCTH